MKPNNIHAVITTTKDDAPPGVIIFQEYPDLHLRQPLVAFIAQATQRGYVVMRAHNDKRWALVNGEWRRFFPIADSPLNRVGMAA